MSRAPPTVHSVKQGFLSTQTNHLSEPLNPSRAWKETNDADEQSLPTRAVQDALHSLNQAVQAHCRRVHAPPATRAVAEQIADDYMEGGWEGGAKSQWTESNLVRESNTCDDKIISFLPSKWPSDKDARALPLEARRYEQLVQQLIGLNDQRQELRLHVEQLRRVAAHVELLRVQNGHKSIQENLITRNGEVEKELERMRVLLARVTGRLDQLPMPNKTPTAEPLYTQSTDVEHFLGGSRMFSS